MRSTLEMLEKKEAHLETKISAEVALARQHAVSNKSRKQYSVYSLLFTFCVIIVALMASKRKKMYESQREHTRGARFNLETQILTIENANINSGDSECHESRFLHHEEHSWGNEH